MGLMGHDEWKDVSLFWSQGREGVISQLSFAFCGKLISNPGSRTPVCFFKHAPLYVGGLFEIMRTDLISLIHRCIGEDGRELRVQIFLFSSRNQKMGTWSTGWYAPSAGSFIDGDDWRLQRIWNSGRTQDGGPLDKHFSCHGNQRKLPCKKSYTKRRGQSSVEFCPIPYLLLYFMATRPHESQSGEIFSLTG